MIEKVLKGSNLKQAIRQTQANKGSARVDRMPVSELTGYFEHHQESLFTKITKKKKHNICWIYLRYKKKNHNT